MSKQQSDCPQSWLTIVSHVCSSNILTPIPSHGDAVYVSNLNLTKKQSGMLHQESKSDIISEPDYYVTDHEVLRITEEDERVQIEKEDIKQLSMIKPRDRHDLD